MKIRELNNVNNKNKAVPNKIIKEITRKIISANSIVIASHIDPDLDALGSVLALTLGLESLNKKVYPLKMYPEHYLHNDLDHINKLISLEEKPVQTDLAIILDTATQARLGYAIDWVKKSNFVISIDHHPFVEKISDLAWLDTNASATSQLTYFLLKKLGVKITPEIASYLYLAIISDTGSFRYGSINKTTFKVVLELVKAGAEPLELAKKAFFKHRKERMKFLGECLYKTLELHDNGKISTLEFTQDMFKRSGLNKEEISGFIDFIFSLNGVLVSIFFREIEENLIKVSFRGRDNIDVGAIAYALGGGGHKCASSASIKGNLSSVKSFVIDFVKNYIDKNKN